MLVYSSCSKFTYKPIFHELLTHEPHSFFLINVLNQATLKSRNANAIKVVIEFRICVQFKLHKRMVEFSETVIYIAIRMSRFRNVNINGVKCYI